MNSSSLMPLQRSWRENLSTLPALQEYGSGKAKLCQLPYSLLTTWIFRSMERRMW